MAEAEPAAVEHQPAPAQSGQWTVRLADAPFFEKRPSERDARPAATRPSATRPAPTRPVAAAPSAPPADPLSAGAPLSARDRLRQAAALQAAGVIAEDGPGIAGHAQLIPGLLAEGRIPEVDSHIAAHASLASLRGSSTDRLDAAAWKLMRALFDGRGDDARSALDLVLALGHAEDRYWTQRFWVGMEWGDETEQCALLDHCREQAYRYDDMRWRASLTVLLARMGRTDEAAREADTVLTVLNGRTAPDGFVDIATDLAEAVFLLGDASHAPQVQKLLAGQRCHLVVAGPAWACKGALARFQAHAAAAAGKWQAADQLFSTAADTHRALAARPLLAHTLREWGSTLVGRDDVRAQRYLDESTALARGLRLTALLAPSPALAC